MKSCPCETRGLAGSHNAAQAQPPEVKNDGDKHATGKSLQRNPAQTPITPHFLVHPEVDWEAHKEVYGIEEGAYCVHFCLILYSKLLVSGQEKPVYKVWTVYHC